MLFYYMLNCFEVKPLWMYVDVLLGNDSAGKGRCRIYTILLNFDPKWSIFNLGGVSSLQNFTYSFIF